VKKIRDQKKLFAKYTMQELFDELDILEIFQHPRNQNHFGEITLKQRKILKQ
jgi:hypothetical protein